MDAYVYILRCKDNTLYTGWTNDIVHRLAAHRAGKGAKYTKGRGPLALAYLEKLENKSDALKREAAIKALTRIEKLRLINDWECPQEFSELINE